MDSILDGQKDQHVTIGKSNELKIDTIVHDRNSTAGEVELNTPSSTILHPWLSQEKSQIFGICKKNPFWFE